MKIYIFFFILFTGIFISGCIDNPLKEVPVIEVNITFIEKDGIVVVENYSLDKGAVSYLNRPKKEWGTFPTIASRTVVSKGENRTIGPWENLPYTGPGTYSFNIGFDETSYPVKNDSVHISIYVIDKNGDRIGAEIRDIIWE